MLQVTIVAHKNELLDCSFSLDISAVTTKQDEIDVLAQGSVLRNHSERCENLPVDTWCCTDLSLKSMNIDRSFS